MASPSIYAAALPKPYIFVDSGGKIWTKNDLSHTQVAHDLKFGTLVVTDNSGLSCDIVIDTISDRALEAAHKWMHARGLTEVHVTFWRTHDDFAAKRTPLGAAQIKLQNFVMWARGRIKAASGTGAKPPGPPVAPKVAPATNTVPPAATKSIRSTKASASVLTAAQKMIETGFKGVSSRPRSNDVEAMVAAALKFAHAQGIACAVVIGQRGWALVPATKSEAASTYGLIGGYWVEPNGTIWIGKAPS